MSFIQVVSSYPFVQRRIDIPFHFLLTASHLIPVFIYLNGVKTMVVIEDRSV